jgi:hypothetical protein
MSQAVFASQEGPPKLFDAGSATPPTMSAAAAALKRWAGVSCRFGVLTATIPVIIALAYVALVVEPLWQRLMTLAVIGLAPAVATILAGFMLGAILDLAGRLTDPVAAATARLTLPLRRAVAVHGSLCLRFAVATTPLAARRVASAAVVAWCAWEDACWTAYRGIRAAIQACGTAMRACSTAVHVTARRVVLWIPAFGRASVAAGWMLVRWSRAGFCGAVCGLRATVDALDALGCAINAAGRLLWKAATFPIRLVARILLWLLGSASARGAGASRRAAKHRLELVLHGEARRVA